ncbi:MAG: glycine cleavage system aminomethyltransferase GcvT [bacterium]
MEKITPIYQRHKELNAQFINFYDWKMPLYYKGIIEEAKAVRSTVGIFDISHMARFIILLNDVSSIDRLFTNDLRLLSVGRAQYTLLCNSDGGILDDTILSRLDLYRYLLVVNASNRYKILDWLCAHRDIGMKIRDITERTGSIAIQGPEAERLTERIFGTSLSRLKRFHLLEIDDTLISRTGYTGEDGFEIISPSEKIINYWDKAIELGVIPCGLGSRDILRLEAGYCLYGNELTEERNPIEAGLERFVKVNNRNFIGSERIKDFLYNGTREKLVWFKLEEKTVPRKGNEMIYGEEKIGVVTSGGYSPFYKTSIGMGYVKRHLAVEGIHVGIRIRDTIREAVISRSNI